jgi:hypothetical protein
MIVTQVYFEGSFQPAKNTTVPEVSHRTSCGQSPHSLRSNTTLPDAGYHSVSLKTARCFRKTAHCFHQNSTLFLKNSMLFLETMCLLI